MHWPFNDALSRAGAERLARTIEAYWRERGYAVQARVERLTVAMAARGEAYAVKTNLVNGWPNS